MSTSVTQDRPAPVVAPWSETEIELTSAASWTDPYGTVDVWAEFTSGPLVVRRPAFWDGGMTWRVRFAPPQAGEWRWRSESSVADAGLADRTGRLICEESADPRGHVFYDRGFWRIPPGGRQLQHADGTTAVLVGDTAWGLPWRATPEQARVYAADRHRKGFNAVLLMTVQPDMGAVGPRDRAQDHGFDRAFEDLPSGHINQINVDYFRRYDVLVDILVEHQIVPVHQPVFQGFGWKGLGVAGVVVPPEEYGRYCRYLVARYGARPAIYLVGADGSGDEPQIEAGGIAVHAADAYDQPTGIHYRPHGMNRSSQDAEWLDFQWCQTGHEGEHVQERVADMWRNSPVRAVANGEPSYENTGVPGRSGGWWQGHEAWSNLCAGGTMGVVYGAASLWQWRLHADEPGHEEYFLAQGAGWREALEFEGSTYVGLVSRILDGLPIAGMVPNWCQAVVTRALAVPGELLLAYRETGGDVILTDDTVPEYVRIVDPRDGSVVSAGKREPTERKLRDPGGAPRLYICTKTPLP